MLRREAPSAGSSKACAADGPRAYNRTPVLSCDPSDNGGGVEARLSLTRAIPMPISRAGSRGSHMSAHDGRQHHTRYGRLFGRVPRRSPACSMPGPSTRAVHPWWFEDVPSCVTQTGNLSESRWRRRGRLRSRQAAAAERPHSTLAYLCLLRGHESVADAMRDEQLAQFVERSMTETSPQALGRADSTSSTTFSGSRDSVPCIRHLLSQIAWDGSKKLPVRLVVTIGEALRAGRPIHRFLCRSPRDALHRPSGQSRRPIFGSVRRAPLEHWCGLQRRCTFRSAAVCGLRIGTTAALMSEERFARSSRPPRGCRAAGGAYPGVILMTTRRISSPPPPPWRRPTPRSPAVKQHSQLVHHVFFWLKNPQSKKIWRGCSRTAHARKNRDRAPCTSCPRALKNATSSTTASAPRKSCSSTTRPDRRLQDHPSTRNRCRLLPSVGTGRGVRRDQRLTRTALEPRSLRRGHVPDGVARARVAIHEPWCVGHAVHAS